ncbi:unnamed protein product, partial [Natator depressus]
ITEQNADPEKLLLFYLRKGHGTRQIPLNDEFLAGYENADLKTKEIIVSVLIPYSKKGIPPQYCSSTGCPINPNDE